MRAVLPDDLTQVVLVGYSFGGFTASRIAVDHPDPPAAAPALCPDLHGIKAWPATGADL